MLYLDPQDVHDVQEWLLYFYRFFNFSHTDVVLRGECDVKEKGRKGGQDVGKMRDVCVCVIHGSCRKRSPPGVF